MINNIGMDFPFKGRNEALNEMRQTGQEFHKFDRGVSASPKSWVNGMALRLAGLSGAYNAVARAARLARLKDYPDTEA
ncbi:MAG: hypothetical protein WBG50_26245 [Desulfomonilaceae bacterium]